MEKPRRKKIRLSEFDYSSNGAYFLTVCTHGKAELFGEPEVQTPTREMICRVFEESLLKYPKMTSPKYVVMPNHVHALVVIDNPDSSKGETIAEMMRSFKSKSTVEYIRLVKCGMAQPFDGKLWQRSYYDHVIRNRQDFEEIWNYIEGNPIRWKIRQETE